MMKKLLKKLARRILKDEILAMTIPKPEAIIIPPEGFKRYRAQRIVPNHEWLLRQVEPDCFIKQFKYDVADELSKEIKIKFEKTPDGVMFSADLLFKNV